MENDNFRPWLSLFRASAIGAATLLVAAGIVLVVVRNPLLAGLITLGGLTLVISLWRLAGNRGASPGLSITEAEMLEAAERYRSVLRAATAYAIIGFDLSGMVKVFNEGAERMLGYSAGEVIDKVTPLQFHDPAEIAARAAELALPPGLEVFTTVTKGEMETREWTYIRKDGSRLPILLSVTTRYDGNGEMLGYLGIAADLSERKQAETAIRRNEELLRQKLDSVLSPAIDIGDLSLAEIVDSATIQPLMEDFSRLTGMTVAILDLKGNVIVATGWQDICTKFHRCNPQTRQFCTESDLYLAGNLKHGEYVSYRCKNHMWDIVTPLSIGSKYLGNIYTGQFFYDDEVVDENIFIEHARKYGIDEAPYLAALRRVPRFSRERVNCLMDYLIKFSDYISRLSFSNLKLARSVSELERARTQSQQQTQFLQTLIDTIPSPVFYKDVQGLYQGCNLAFAQAIGRRKEEIIGKSVYDLYPKEQADIYYQMDGKLFSAPGVQIYETDLPPLNGISKRVIFNKATYLNTDGSVAGLIGVVVDITERKRYEEIIQNERQQLLSIFGSIDEIIYVIDPQSRDILYVNDAALRLLRENPVGKKCHQVLFGHDQPCEFCSGQYLLKHKNLPYRWEYHNPILNRDYSVVDRLIRWPDGREVKFELALDITERKQGEAEKARLQEELIQAKKMESVGQLAGGVAHDFNNMLQVILGYTDFALKNIPPDPALQKSLEQVQNAARHSSELTRQLLAFARKQTVCPQILDLNDAVSSMLKMLQRLIGENINLIWKPAAEPWLIKIDPAQVDQILANLSVNARDAISGSGTLYIQTRNVAIDQAYCNATGHESRPGNYVMLEVSDTGCGMDAKTMENLFVPFFTTKELGRGTGLGLSTIFGIVKQNDGFIHVYSEPGHGSTFKIYFPRCHDQSPENRDNANDTTAPAKGHETILLTEDDPAILELGRFILEDYGYTVLTAASPQESLAIATTHPAHLDLLITDVVMPQMNGRELMEKITAIHPETKVIYMSGYTADVIAHHGIIEDGINFLQKPFSEDSLTSCIRKVLDTP